MIDQTLLDILVCPACRTAVRLEAQRLVCVQCGRRYPIREDIPIMLLEEADPPAGSPSPASGA